MKSFLTLGLALASLTFAAAGCSDNKSATKTTTAAPATDSPMAADSAGTSTMAPATAATIYTCSMHPEVTSDKPGKCPKCGMDLIVKK
ncbi:MAG: hypothetical protein EOO57_04090 [Hymenobacter sp.]|jgi:hypothetical protein|nr:MAG: hypothetical protein EOO57_04090 [Hymenobacter sp.]